MIDKSLIKSTVLYTLYIVVVKIKNGIATNTVQFPTRELALELEYKLSTLKSMKYKDSIRDIEIDREYGTDITVSEENIDDYMSTTFDNVEDSITYLNEEFLFC